MSRIFTECSIGTVTCKNRIVFAPTTIGRLDPAYYEQLAAGDVGMIVVADLSVVPSMLGEPGLESMEAEKLLREITDVCHRHGCKVAAQLFHPEYDPQYIRGLYLQARNESGITPDQVRAELSKNTKLFCDSLSEEKIQELIHAFGEAAKRAERMGFDLVQIHGDRLLGSFTSPLFNHRGDTWGSHIEFPRKVVCAVRQAVPSMPIDYKLTIRMEAEQLGCGGIGQDEIQEFVRALDESGVSSYHVTLANHTDIQNTIPKKNHPLLKEYGCFVPLAKLVKRYTKHPVCAVGKIQTPEMAESILSQGIDMFAMSRQLVADPEWPNKVAEHRENEINYCLYCNTSCMTAIRSGQRISCVLRKGTKDEV